MGNKVAFALYYNQFEDKLSTMIRLRFHINSLLQMNSGGTVHSDEEFELLAAEVK